MSQPTEEQQEAMLAEIAAAVPWREIPPQAMTAHELLARQGSPRKDALKAFLHAEVEAGRWLKARKGQSVYYWKAE